MLSQIKQAAPLIHCITNYVVANFSANGLLAVGASPIMADEIKEVSEVVSSSDGVLINIGTVNDFTIESMLVAGKKANELNIPIVLDPVGIGATDYRKRVVRRLLKEVKFNLIRCNAGELASIAGADWQAKGVDSGEGFVNTDTLAQEVALKYGCMVAVTGRTDFLTDGHAEYLIRGGNETATHITGMGCLLSAICAASIASSNRKEELKSLASTLKDYKKAAELSSDENGSFIVQFIDNVQKIAEVKK